MCCVLHRITNTEELAVSTKVDNMSFSRSNEGIGAEDRRIFRLYKVCTCEGRQTFYFIFQWGCKRDLTKSLKDYLRDDKGMTSKYYKRVFNADMRKKIDDNPSGDDFDLSLLFACIQTACTGLAELGNDWTGGDDTKLESICTSIKNFRNNLIHESKVGDDFEMNAKLTRFQDLLEKAINLAGNLYDRLPSEINNEIQAMKDNINKIMNASVMPLDIDKCLEEIKELREKQKELVREKGPVELVQKYESMTRVDPASFITGKERLQVKNIFTRLEVIKEQDGASVSESVEYENLVALTTEDGKKPVVTVVEGDAGAGKTTLAKLILDDWSSVKTSGAPPTFHGLDAYDLVLYAEARNKSVDSFLALLWVLMPQVRNELTDVVLVQSVLNLNVLLAIDGLDELNAASTKLIDDVFDRHIPASSGKLKVLVTTRPNMLDDLPSILRKQTKVHTKLRGIAPEMREEFVRKLHDEMRKESVSKQNTQDLVDYLKQSRTRLGEHYRLPLNLTLLTYLWADDPFRVNLVTTATDLYIALLELIKKRLTERLRNIPGVAGKDLSKACEEFLPELYSVSLETLSSGNIQLSPKSKERLENKCSKLSLPSYDMCASFLVLEKEWTPYGYKFEYYVPHKSIMEFYAAFRIFCALTISTKDSLLENVEKENISEETKEKIRQILMEDEDQQPKELLDIMKNLLPEAFKPDKLFGYQNMLLHLGGLLAHERPDVLQQYAGQLVDLLQHSKVKGTQWLDLVVETKCDDTVADLVAPRVTKQLVVRDGHTGAALKMFTRLPSNIPVEIILENEVHSIPHLDELLEEVSKRSCDVELLLKHQWKHSQYGRSDDLLKNLMKDAGGQKCRLSRFWGYLGSFAVLPMTVTSLHFNIVDDIHAKAISAELATLTKTLSLETLGVHVMRGVSPKYLKKLPVVKPIHQECGSLWVSNVVEEVEWACQVARSLLPEEGRYRSIIFPRSNLRLAKCKELLTKLKEKRIKITRRGSFLFSSDTISKTQLVDLRQMAREALDADLCNVTCCEESGMW